MSDNEDLGTLSRINGCLEGRLARHLDHEQGKVWTMLTAPARIGGIIERVVACISLADFLSSTSSFSKFSPNS